MTRAGRRLPGIAATGPTWEARCGGIRWIIPEKAGYWSGRGE